MCSVARCISVRGSGGFGVRAWRDGSRGAEIEELLRGGEGVGEFADGGVGGDETAVEVGERARLHGFAPAVAATGDEGCVDGVVGLGEPFVFAFAAEGLVNFKSGA